MSFAPFTRTALGFGLGATLCVAALSAVTLPQAAVSVPLAINTARVTIDGNSNLHPYTASSTAVRLTRVQVAADVAGPDVWGNLVKPGAVQAFEIAIPVLKLSSPKEGLDKNMHKALKAQEHPEITFRLLRLEAAGPDGTFRGVGVLRVAGVEKEIALAVTTQLKDGAMTVKGEVDLLMPDFGIAPPKAMLGMLKTDPKVKVTFETLLAIGTT
jgi:polyisoprenoid-binding protein YceI